MAAPPPVPCTRDTGAPPAHPSTSKCRHDLRTATRTAFPRASTRTGSATASPRTRRAPSAPPCTPPAATSDGPPRSLPSPSQPGCPTDHTSPPHRSIAPPHTRPMRIRWMPLPLRARKPCHAQEIRTRTPSCHPVPHTTPVRQHPCHLDSTYSGRYARTRTLPYPLRGGPHAPRTSKEEGRGRKERSGERSDGHPVVSRTRHGVLRSLPFVPLPPLPLDCRRAPYPHGGCPAVLARQALEKGGYGMLFAWESREPRWRGSPASEDPKRRDQHPDPGVRGGGWKGWPANEHGVRVQTPLELLTDSFADVDGIL